MKHKNLMTGVAVSLFCTAVLGGCSSDTSNDTAGSVEPGYWSSQETDTLEGNEFQTVAESNGMELQLNPETAMIRWVNNETGEYKDTNLNGSAWDGNNNSKSDLVFSYFNGTESDPYATTANYDSFSKAVKQDGQIAYQLMDNGVRIIYTIGENSINHKNFPLDISGERMEEFVLQYMTPQEQEIFRTSYYTRMNDGHYHRKSNDDAPLAGMAVNQLYKQFYEIGTYTEEELYKDLEEWGADEDEYPVINLFNAAVEYTLEDGELVVNMDTSLIEVPETMPLSRIQMLPYFLTSDVTGEDKEGYMFIPDGSGALIYLDSTKMTEYRYQEHFYNDDQLVDATTYSRTDAHLQMPVYGMKTSDSTILGVIENGAEVATLDAVICGFENSEPFAKMRVFFDIRENQAMKTESDSGYTVNKATDDIYDGLITLRFFWLDDDADYVDMANCYAAYLEEKGALTAKDADEEAPMYVEVLGTTDKTQYFLGIPYEGKEILTTFDEAKAILTDLDASGVKNIKLIYSGMVNGGMNQRGLEKGVKFAADLGGGSDFKALASYADSIGAEVYPNLLLQSLYTKKGLSSGNMAFNIVNARAQLYRFNPVLTEVDDEVEYPQYVVSPNYIAEYWKDVKSSYSKKTGLTTMASEDLMVWLGTNYRDDHVSPGTAHDIYTEAVADLADGMSLMMYNPIADAYAYTNVLTDIPTGDSGLRILDASIPFMQIVLDGSKTYSTESLNLDSTDIQADFMKAIETKSAPKFTFTYRDSALLADTTQDDLFAVDYNYWKDSVGTYYAEYQEFYEAVKDAVIEEHELFDRNEDLRVVTYSNGVKVYLNYSNQDEKIDGVKVPALSYEIVK